MKRFTWFLLALLNAGAGGPVLAGDGVSVQSLPPVVVATVPQAGDSWVDPATSEVRVTFSKDMLTDNMWSWVIRRTPGAAQPFAFSCPTLQILPMPDYWTHCGHHLLDQLPRGQPPGPAHGYLGVTDDFMRAYVERPEMALVEESCEAERALHKALLANPREAVSAARLDALTDEDARDNYRTMLALRDRLVAADTVEDCYRGMFRGNDKTVSVPPLFLDQLAQVILRGLLGDDPDPLRARAAELLFRPQQAMIQDGAVLLGDRATVQMARRGSGYGDLGRLVAEAGTPLAKIEMDVLNRDNGALYWGRDERFDTALDVTFARPGLDALARLLETWVEHFTGAAVSIQPVAEISDQRWVWHVGLDAEATVILNNLYDGAEVDDDRLARILALFRLEFKDPGLMLPRVAGRPVYLAMAMDDDEVLRFKPQNLLVNLPLAPEA
ncbi:MAG: DUF6352 family protein [Alphaproteobacteria bacterium]